MLYLVCGEDSVSSRNYFLSLQEEYKKKQFEISQILPSDLETITSDTALSPNLFGQQRIFVTENVNKIISRKKGNKTLEIIEKIASNPEIVLIDWEDKTQARELKTGKLGRVKEFRPSVSIFKLLYLCYPSKMKEFLVFLSQICTSQNEMFVYIMLTRHMRNIMLLSAKASLPGLQIWQLGKLRSQAENWQQDRLTSFYEKLIGIDISLKTGGNPYGIKRSIEMLCCYYV